MKRILVAEDRAASRELIRTVLEDCGYEVMEAADGGEAVTRAASFVPDLILLDLHMPVLDGYGVVRRLRADVRFANIPLVALTANAMEGERERALAEGFSAYITKPVNLVSLRAQIAGLLETVPPS
jgi:two-component system cell cycle response regulator DivK